ncbi:MAG: DnaA regulatory inactivator Hda [Neisseriales bacterium]|nr:MAG: DnaA regulatory inactivator Hda [Neisseriales bacterium]
MPTSQLIFNLNLPSHYDFNHFIVGDNHEALAMLASKNTERFIALWGYSGAGKTHLLKAWIQQATIQKLPALYIDARHTKLTHAIKHANQLAVDHIEALDTESQTTLFAIYNAFRTTPSARLLIASNCPPSQLVLRDDLRSRISAGLVYEIHALSDEHKFIALRTYAQAKQINIPDNILRYLLHHFQRNLSALTLLIDTLDREALSHHHPITLPFLKSILSI